MTEPHNARSKPGRRLPSIFDGVPPGTPLSLSVLETLMQADTQRRILAVLDRVFAKANQGEDKEIAESSKDLDRH
ncbi:MAG: hypothetical protein C0467_21535 [Planctomycetaceae bacterium]|nr:hypothetical protein [Planctomycetaceae bacterium]